jgi:hypothetical protein
MKNSRPELLTSSPSHHHHHHHHHHHNQDRTRTAESRAVETLQQRQARLEQDRTRKAESRAAVWSNLNLEAFSYDPNDYGSHPNVMIGRMNVFAITVKQKNL